MSTSFAARFEAHVAHVEAREASFARPWCAAAHAALRALSPADRDLVQRARDVAHEATLDAIKARTNDGFISFEAGL